MLEVCQRQQRRGAAGCGLWLLGLVAVTATVAYFGTAAVQAQLNENSSNNDTSVRASCASHGSCPGTDFCLGCSFEQGECWEKPGLGERCLQEDSSAPCVPHGCQEGLLCANGRCRERQDTLFSACLSTDDCGANQFCKKCTCTGNACHGVCTLFGGYNEDCSFDDNDECSAPRCRDGLLCDGSLCKTDPWTAVNICASIAPCKNGGTCAPTSDSPLFTCTCPPGWEGETCEVPSTDPCASQPCDNGGICLPFYGQTPPYRCLCEDGFVRVACDFAVCDYNPCLNGAKCIERSDNSQVCSCNEGTSGALCDSVPNDPCGASPCTNGGVCHSQPGGVGENGESAFECACPPQFTGETCAAVADPCYAEPCGTHGTCVPYDIDGFLLARCECDDGVSGQACTINEDNCSQNPCQHGGTCIDRVDDFECSCTDDYTGSLCEVPLFTCKRNPCQNGGTCTDLSASEYECSCPDGFTGTNCEVNLDDCSPNPCRNGGACMDLANGYHCICPSQYSGVICTQPRVFCYENRCMNGACVEEEDGFRCECHNGYAGATCNERVTACSSHPCNNGGTCIVDGRQDAHCECVNGYSGQHCDVAPLGDTLSPLANGQCPVGYVPDTDQLCHRYHWLTDTARDVPALPVRLSALSAAKHGNYVFIFGDGEVGTENKKWTVRYNWQTRTFSPVSQLAQRPHFGDTHAIEAFGGKLYLFGGLCCQDNCRHACGAEGEVQIYDIARDSWSRGPAIAWEVLGALSSAVIGSKAYLCGGKRYDGLSERCGAFNFVTSAWEPVASMPLPVRHAAAGTDGSKLYIFGGIAEEDAASNGFRDVQIYDPETDTWEWSATSSTLRRIPIGRPKAGKAAFLNGEFYIIGGEGSTNSPATTATGVYASVQIFNPATNEWREGPDLPTPVHSSYPVVVDSAIEVFGGSPSAGRSTSYAHQVLAPAWRQ